VFKHRIDSIAKKSVNMFSIKNLLWWMFASALFPHISLCSPDCQDIIISVTASAENMVLPSTLTVLDLTIALLDNVADLPTAAIAGIYSISAVYCEPEIKVTKRHNTLQILSHGAVRPTRQP
jgi:hypothetical protein